MLNKYSITIGFVIILNNIVLSMGNSDNRSQLTTLLEFGIEVNVPSDSLTISQIQNCEFCPNGIGASLGDKPFLKVGFSTAETLLVCGHLNRSINKMLVNASEFDIYHCPTGKAMLTVGAVENRNIQVKRDTLEITQFILLPTDSNWNYSSYPFRRWIFTPVNGSIFLSGPIFIFKVPELPGDWINRAITYYDTSIARFKTDIGSFPNRDFHRLVNLLLTCMITGNKEAEIRFSNLIDSGLLDGAFAETYFYSKNIYRIILESKK